MSARRRGAGQLTARQILDRAEAERREKAALRDCKRRGHSGDEGQECPLCRDQLALFEVDQDVATGESNDSGDQGGRVVRQRRRPASLRP